MNIVTADVVLPAAGANTAALYTLAGFEGPLGGGGREGKRRGKSEGRKTSAINYWLCAWLNLNDQVTIIVWVQLPAVLNNFCCSCFWEILFLEQAVLVPWCPIVASEIMISWNVYVSPSATKTATTTKTTTTTAAAAVKMTTTTV